MALMIEIKPIPDFPGYFVSNEGDVFSSWEKGGRDQNGQSIGARIGSKLKKLAPTVDSAGRPIVNLYRDKKPHMLRTSVLVLTTFRGPRPNGYEACHFPDRDIKNNRLDNLRWGTKKENAADREAHGTTYHVKPEQMPRGESHANSKLTDDIVRKIRTDIKNGLPQRHIAKKYGVGQPHISKIYRNEIWSHIQ